MKRYNFNKDNELNLLASNNDLRPCLTCIYFDNFDAIVSDAYCIFKIPVNRISNLSGDDTYKLNGKLLKANDYKRILKFDVINIGDDGITAHKGELTEFFKFQDFTYIDYEKILSGMRKSEPAITDNITFNVERLFNMFRAYGNKQAIPTLQYKGEGNAIEVVFDDNDNDIEAFIMPCNR